MFLTLIFNFVLFLFFLCMGSFVVTATNLLLFMISLEMSFLSVVCGFVLLSSFLVFVDGVVFSFFFLGIAAVEAIVGFYFIIVFFFRFGHLFFNFLQFRG